MSDPNSASVGTGHGAVMYFHDPGTPGTPFQNRDFGGPNDSPMGTGKTSAASTDLGYLIRDLELHEEFARPHDITDLRIRFAEQAHRVYAQPYRWSIGPMTFTVLIDTEVPLVLNLPAPDMPNDTNAAFNNVIPKVEPKYIWDTYESRPQPLPTDIPTTTTRQPYPFGRGHVSIILPIRNPSNNTPAVLTSVFGDPLVDTGINAIPGAFITSRSYGSMRTNQPMTARISLQWAYQPFFSSEQAV